MSVFAIDPEGRAKPLRTLRCRDEEKELQQLLAQNPELLRGDQVEPRDPCRWLLVRRELPVPDPATGSNRWSIDHVFADQNAVPTLVECKRFADSRARREVVGQMLEYAANGHHYWEAEELRHFAEESAGTAGHTLEDALLGLNPSGGSAPEEFFAAFVENLRAGRVRLVFFMEEAPTELKSIIEFLNRQMERTEVLVIEARQYELEGQRIVTPSLFGFTEEARRTKRADPGRSRGVWNQATFLEDARARLDDGAVRALERLLAFSRDQGFEVSWGVGRTLGSFLITMPELQRRTLFAVYSTGRINWYVGYLNEALEQVAFRDELIDRLVTEFEAEFPPDVQNRYPPLPVEKWAHRVGELERLLAELAEKHRKRE